MSNEIIQISKLRIHHPIILLITILQALTMTRKLIQKIALSKNAAMTLGQWHLVMIHAPIVVQVHLNKNVRDKGSSKYPRVHKKANQFKPNMERRIVIIEAIGVPVR